MRRRSGLSNRVFFAVAECTGCGRPSSRASSLFGRERRDKLGGFGDRCRDDRSRVLVGMGRRSAMRSQQEAGLYWRSPPPRRHPISGRTSWARGVFADVQAEVAEKERPAGPRRTRL